jgi:hypothetical protein
MWLGLAAVAQNAQWDFGQSRGGVEAPRTRHEWGDFLRQSASLPACQHHSVAASQPHGRVQGILLSCMQIG